MRKVILSMSMTLDGFAAGPNDEMDWLPPFGDEEVWRDQHEDMWRQLSSVDTFLLGRRTYRIWEQYWPAAGRNPASTKNDVDFSRFADRTRKIVFSTTLDEVRWQNSELVTGDAAEAVRRLEAEPGKDIALAGGAALARSFMEMDLVDEYGFIVHPVILGQGKPLFPSSGRRLELELRATKTYAAGAVLLAYRRKKSA